MVNSTITLTWSDGKKATAKIQAVSAEADYPVRYEGDLSRLAEAPRSACYAFLAFMLRHIAAKTGAEYHEDASGNYDRFAV